MSAKKLLRRTIKRSKLLRWKTLRTEVNEEPWGLGYKIVMHKFGALTPNAERGAGKILSTHFSPHADSGTSRRENEGRRNPTAQRGRTTAGCEIPGKQDGTMPGWNTDRSAEELIKICCYICSTAASWKAFCQNDEKGSASCSDDFLMQREMRTRFSVVLQTSMHAAHGSETP